VLSTVNALLQLFLPGWVRARGLAIYIVVLYGAQALGAVVWGTVADVGNLTVAFLAAGAVMLIGVVAGLRWPLRDVSGLDRTAATPWPEARLAFDPELDAGPVLVTTEYVVAADDAEAFIDAMEAVGRMRRRTGATTWFLYRDGADPSRFLETFELPTWDVHRRQHGGRLTGFDAELEHRADQLAASTSTTRHFFPADAIPPEAEDAQPAREQEPPEPRPATPPEGD
jgi:Transmembrane secretion effector